MGRYAEPLAKVFVAFAGVGAGDKVLDVGCGPGALAPFWDAVHVLDPEAQDEGLLSGAHRGHLTELFEAAGLRDVEEDAIAVDVVHPTFEEWWEPYTYGVGPAGDYVARLDDDGRARLASVARERLGSGPFTVTAAAWAARGTV